MATKAIQRWTAYADWDALPVLMTVEEACAVLKLSENTTLKLLTTGKLPGVKIGNLWRISKDDLRAYLCREKQPPQPDKIDVLCGIMKELLEEVRQLKQ